MKLLITHHLSHALSAVWFNFIGIIGWPTMGGRLAQYHRAKALPNWALSVYKNFSKPVPIDISVVITCFNYEDYLEKAVKSVIEAASFNRDLKIEVLIFDDNSTDNSFRVAKSLFKSCPLPISIMRPWWNVGVSKGRNVGLDHARGDFIFILDADNILARDSLSNLYNCAMTEKSAAAYGPIRRVLLDGTVDGMLSNYPFDPDILHKKGNYIDAMALFSKPTLVALGGYDVNLLKIIGGWEDYELWLRLAANECKVSFCQNSTIGDYLVKPNSMVKKMSYKDIFNGLNALREPSVSQELKSNTHLIFDFGFHLGDDTFYYLELGFNVVAIEADPNLYRLGLDRFSNEIDDKRLTLINAAAVSRDQRLRQSKINFYPHAKNTLWGSVNIDFVKRNTTIHKSPHEPAILVDTISLEEVVERYGCPSFLKIDIEGMDAAVVEDLDRLPILPEFVSWETGKKSLFQVLHTHLRLFGLGYRRFRVVQQMYNPIHIPTEYSSKPFSNPTVDSSGPIPSHHTSSWGGILSAALTYIFLFIIYKLIGPKSLLSWCENHPSIVLHTVPRYLRKEMSRRRIPFPGWFDTHAALPEERTNNAPFPSK